MALFIQPWHIATRGRFDGEYGIATRGYVICPSLVSRLPVDGGVIPEKLFGVITEDELEAILRDVGWLGLVEQEGFGLDAAWSLATHFTAEVTGVDLLEAVVSAHDPLVGLVTCLEDVSAQIGAGGTVGVVDGDHGSSAVVVNEVSGSLEEKPGEGACQVDEDVEPC